MKIIYSLIILILLLGCEDFSKPKGLQREDLHKGILNMQGRDGKYYLAIPTQDGKFIIQGGTKENFNIPKSYQNQFVWETNP